MTLTTHEVKIHPEHFKGVTNPSRNHRKLVELRFNDRNYKVGDTMLMREFCPTRKDYTRNWAKVRITHVLKAEAYLKEGYVALSIILLEFRNKSSWKGKQDERKNS